MFSMFLNVNHIEMVVSWWMGGGSDEKSESIFEISVLELVKIDISINFFNFFEF